MGIERSLELSNSDALVAEEMEAFAQREVLPYASSWDKAEAMDPEVIRSLSKRGWLGALAPKAYGGQDMDPLLWGRFCESIGTASSSLLGLPTVHGMAIQAIARWGTDAQKETVLPMLASGEAIGAFALTEPEVGSDAANVQTVAEATGSGFRLTGRKRWITFGNIADWFVVVARLEDKPTAFLVPSTNSGLKITPVKDMLGFRSAELANLHFENCEVTEDAILGRPGFGFSHVAGTALDHGRFCIAWGCVGLAQGCLSASMEHAQEREQFGKPISEHQLIQRLIADMLVGTRAARGLCLEATALKRAGDPRVIMETSIAKYYASQHAAKASRDAVQILGGTGCSSEGHVERYFRDAKVTEIIEGSSQIQQLIIARHGLMQHRKEKRKKATNP